jgi:poly(3-hydroxyalkanoate) synthetase
MIQKFKNSKIVIDTPIYALHSWGNEKGIPKLINSAAAGRHPNIAQNLIDALVEYGKTVYAYELKPATQKTKNTSIENLVEGIHECVQFITEPVDLICLCQGTLPGAIYASIFPENVNKYANIAGTINSHTGCKNLIEQYMKISGVVEYHAGIVAMNGGVQKGSLQAMAMSMVDPVSVYITTYYDLFNMIVTGDDPGIKKWHRNDDWLQASQDIAGKWFLQCLEWLFRDNRLYNGTFPDIMDREVRLSNIVCPIHLFAGDNDKITDKTQVFGMAEKVGSNVKTKTLFTNSGHTSSFTRNINIKKFIDVFGIKNEIN